MHTNPTPRSICPVCGPIVIATRGSCPAGATGFTTGNRIPREVLACRACKGTGVFVPTRNRPFGRTVR